MNIHIPFEIIEFEENSYHIVIQASINNYQTNILIDTGASKSVFNKTIPDAIFLNETLHNENSLYSAAVNSVIISAVNGVIKELKIGRFILRDYETVFIDLSHVNKLYSEHIDMQIDGLIGSDFLVQFKGIIDYPNKVLKLNISGK